MADKKDQSVPKKLEDDWFSPKSIEKEMEKVKQQKSHCIAEGMIREIDDMICRLDGEHAKAKSNLEHSLKKIASHGLSDDLQLTLRNNGLANEALTLVREYLTTKSDLAKFLVDTSVDELPDKVKMISRKLKPKLEVLGELVNRGYDASDERVKKLIRDAPSVRELARLVKNTTKLRELDFGVDERKEIHNLSKADSPVNKEDAAAKKEREEKLEKAKKLMKEAKKLASENQEKNQKQVDEKIRWIKSLISLPEDWNQIDKDSPEQMLAKLNVKIKEMGEFQEATTGFDTVEEIVRNASGGLALKGIYYSMWDKPQTSIMPILDPPQKVYYWNAQSPYETGLRQFSEGHSAALFSKEVEDSGFSHADSLYGSFGGFTAETSVAYTTQTTDEFEHSSKTTTTNVSATNFCRCVMKCFAIPVSCFNLTTAAREMALGMSKKHGTNEAAVKDEIRRFFKIYGSHVPCGMHQLGGLFFAMSTATSQTAMETSKLMHLNSSKLTTKVSAGYFAGSWGVGASDQHDQSWSKGSSKSAQTEDESIHYTFSVKSIGPHADNPGSFKKALSTNNATWAILDRGDMAVNVPVWELIRVGTEGDKFRSIAKMMEDTWKQDERKRKFGAETQQTMRNLANMFMMLLNPREKTSPLLPLAMGEIQSGAVIKYSETFKDILLKSGKREVMLDKAVNFICEDPENHICEFHCFPSNDVIMVKGYKAIKSGRVVFSESSGRPNNETHILFYHTSLWSANNQSDTSFLQKSNTSWNAGFEVEDSPSIGTAIKDILHWKLGIPRFAINF